MSMFRSLISTISGGGSILPPTYQQVEYIRTTGDQYINLGFYGSNTIDYDMEFCWNAMVHNNQNYLCGFENYTPRLTADGTSQTNLNVLYYGYTAYTISNLTMGTKYKISIKGTNTYLNDNLIITRNRISGTDTYPLMLFNYPYNPAFGPDASLYSLKFYENNVLIRDFIPCYRKSDNEIGLYDIVNNVFYTNDGTGTFIKGNDV